MKTTANPYTHHHNMRALLQNVGHKISYFILALALSYPSSCNSSEAKVYLSKYGECFHTKRTCAGENPSKVSLSVATERGRRPCMKCAKEYSHLNY